MSVVTWIHEFNANPAGALPRNVFGYVLGTSRLHQLFLLALTVGVFLLEVVPLELQRRIVNDLVKHRSFSWVIGLCAQDPRSRLQARLGLERPDLPVFPANPHGVERAMELSTTQSYIPALHSAFRDCADILQCPVTGNPLVAVEDGWSSAGGQRHYPVDHGIPQLFAPVDPTMSDRDVTEMVKAFYEETPFPNYDDIDSRETLVMKSRQGRFAAALDAQLPEGAIVLEAGCGTGQLTNFLGLSWKRRVLGGDICLNSLRLANDFRERYRIANAGFLQMNLFRPPFRDGSIDVLICNGVLHHTGDARKGFETLLSKVKPGGHILIGLYNSYGRLPTLWRRRAFERFGPALYFLDSRLTSARMNEGRWQAWFRDQYRHPHETRHSIDEVLGWFDTAGVDFLSSIPAADGSPFTNDTRLFAPHPRATPTGRWATQLQMLLTGGRDGGLFIMIGRKRH